MRYTLLYLVLLIGGPGVLSANQDVAAVTIFRSIMDPEFGSELMRTSSLSSDALSPRIKHGERAYILSDVRFASHIMVEDGRIVQIRWAASGDKSIDYVSRTIRTLVGLLEKRDCKVLLSSTAVNGVVIAGVQMHHAASGLSFYTGLVDTKTHIRVDISYIVKLPTLDYDFAVVVSTDAVNPVMDN